MTHGTHGTHVAHGTRGGTSGGPLRRAARWARGHKIPVASIVAGLAGLTTIAGFLLTTFRTDPGPLPQLQVASFDVGSVSRHAQVDGNGYTEKVARDPAVVQVGLRNGGDAPAYLTRAVVTVREFAPLETCLAFGDALYVTDSVDVQIPYELREVPWTFEVPIAFRVAPNDVDRLELTFSVPDLPPFVQPVAVSLDIAVVEDLGAEPLPVGTAHLLVPDANVLTALEGLLEEPVVPVEQGCNERNLGTLERVLAAPALEVAGTSAEYQHLMDAIEAWEDGEFYVLPAQP